MDTQYYYIRIPPNMTNEIVNPRKVSWVPCSEERAEKRWAIARDTESFNHYVALVTETEGKDGEITICEAFENDDNWKSLITLTVQKEHIFGGHDKAYRAQVALKIFEDAMDACVSEMTAQ